MADRPILFSAPMVRALLDGRKTQTRRILKPQPECGYAGDTPYFSWNGFSGLWPDDWQTAVERNVKIAPSDRLWVKETWSIPDAYLDGSKPDLVIYRATPWATPGAWRPSIFMPRWASRLTLPVTDVRVERLQDISEADAIAEGAEKAFHDGLNSVLPDEEYRAGYARLWDRINGAGAWGANPWVAAYTFTVERGNIDQIGRAA